MLSIKAVVGLFTAIVVVLCVIYFVISRKSEKLRNHRKTAFIIIPVIFIGLYFTLLNHVYILKEQNGGYEEKVLFLPTQFRLSNGSEVALSPKLGIYSIVVNDTKYKAVFETVVYGQAVSKPDVLLAPRTVTYINGTTDYILKEPPKLVSTKGSGTNKGWIHF